jgi:hypothetical protein
MKNKYTEMNMFDDTLLLFQGLEYKAMLPDGHIVHYLSRETAETYRDTRCAQIIAPMQGPNIPECFKEFA